MNAYNLVLVFMDFHGLVHDLIHSTHPWLLLKMFVVSLTSFKSRLNQLCQSYRVYLSHLYVAVILASQDKCLVSFWWMYFHCTGPSQ